jgi:biopolymer transport protein ExbD
MREKFEEAEEDTGEINLVPYMDIVTNIIIFLLASVVHQVPLGTINVSSPTFGSGASAETEPQKPALNLTVTVGASGFILAGSGGVMPSIPKLPNKLYDFQALTSKLEEIKKTFSDETKATFNADTGTPYDIVVQTLDAMREDKSGKMLFPDIVFAAGIL